MAKSTRAINCEVCPLRKRSTYRRFTSTEGEFVKRFKSGELVIQSGATLYEQGTDSLNLYTVVDGGAFRSKMLEDGRRQILNFALPGDLLGLQATLFSSLETRSRLCRI